MGTGSVGGSRPPISFTQLQQQEVQRAESIPRNLPEAQEIRQPLLDDQVLTQGTVQEALQFDQAQFDQTVSAAGVDAEDGIDVDEMARIQASLEPPVHTVQSGDNLTAIARSQGFETNGSDSVIQEYAQANGIADPNLIHVGQQIQTPGTLLTQQAVDLAGQAPPEGTDPMDHKLAQLTALHRAEGAVAAQLQSGAITQAKADELTGQITQARTAVNPPPPEPEPPADAPADADAPAAEDEATAPADESAPTEEAGDGPTTCEVPEEGETTETPERTITGDEARDKLERLDETDLSDSDLADMGDWADQVEADDPELAGAMRAIAEHPELREVGDGDLVGDMIKALQDTDDTMNDYQDAFGHISDLSGDQQAAALEVMSAVLTAKDQPELATLCNTLAEGGLSDEVQEQIFNGLKDNHGTRGDFFDAVNAISNEKDAAALADFGAALRSWEGKHDTRYTSEVSERQVNGLRAWAENWDAVPSEARSHLKDALNDNHSTDGEVDDAEDKDLYSSDSSAFATVLRAARG